MFNRVLIKLSGEALGTSSRGFNDQIILDISKQIKKLLEKKTEIGLVVGGGNFFRGRSANLKDETIADNIGMLATVMNALYLSDVFKSIGIKCRIMTPFLVGSMTKLFNKACALRILKKKEVAIFAGGLGHPFFSTDTIAALRARELNCDAILYAKNINGIYDGDPNINKNAKKFKTISYYDIVKKNLGVIDVAAAHISQNITSIVFNINSKNIMEKVCNESEDIFEFATLVKNEVNTEYYD
ncbi:MAG: UMP kinase [Clostridiales bacterium]|jgi:uridylate kinase|nr:UMP kinase [Clostridiales bacterium]